MTKHTWEQAFDEKFGNNLYEQLGFDDYKLIAEDVTSFISHLLASKKEELEAEIERLNKTMPGIHEYACGYNKALDDIKLSISKIME